MALTLLWIVCHGLASVKFIQHVLHTFPKCASFGMPLHFLCSFSWILLAKTVFFLNFVIYVICFCLGEALLVTAGFVVYFGDMFAFTISKVTTIHSLHHFSWSILLFTVNVKKFMCGI